MKKLFAFVLRNHSRYSNEMSELDLTKNSSNSLQEPKKIVSSTLISQENYANKNARKYIKKSI